MKVDVLNNTGDKPAEVMDATLESFSLSGESSDGETIDETRGIKVIQGLKQKLAIAETTILNQNEKNKLYEATIKDKNDLIELINQNKELMIKQLKDQIADLQNALDLSKKLSINKDDANTAESVEYKKQSTENYNLQTLQFQCDESQVEISALAVNISQLKGEMAELKSKMRDKDDEITKLKAESKAAEDKLRAIITKLDAKIDEVELKGKDTKIVNNTSKVERFESTDDPIDFLNHSEWPNIKFIQIGDRKMPPLLENIPSAGADWMVILRRFDGSQNFSKNSCSYEKGFGDVSGEFWLGLESIHQLTSSRQHELYIELVGLENETFYARYDNFVVGSKGESYALKSLGACSRSSHWDWFQEFVDEKFVYDTTQDYYWWFQNDLFCCLTGKYKVSGNDGMYWTNYGKTFGLKACKMLIRPKL